MNGGYGQFQGRLVMRVEPLGDKIIVKRLEAEEQTAGGIVLPGSAQAKPQEGRVLSVGAGRQLKDGSLVTPQVKEGDRVVFTSYAGAEVEVDDEIVLIMSESEVLAVLN